MLQQTFYSSRSIILGLNHCASVFFISHAFSCATPYSDLFIVLKVKDNHWPYVVSWLVTVTLSNLIILIYSTDQRLTFHETLQVDRGSVFFPSKGREEIRVHVKNRKKNPSHVNFCTASACMPVSLSDELYVHRLCLLQNCSLYFQLKPDLYPISVNNTVSALAPLSRSCC